MTSFASEAYVVPASSRVPSTPGSVVIVKWSPAFSVTPPSSNSPSRIFGPWRSASTATACSEASLAARTRR